MGQERFEKNMMGNISLKLVRSLIDDESKSLKALSDYFSDEILLLIDSIKNCHGNVITFGVGKSSFIAQFLASSLSSVGVRAFFLNATDALHGDIGKVNKDDVLVFFSKSNETSELNDIFFHLKKIKSKKIIITSNKNSKKSKEYDLVIDIGNVVESNKSKIIPTTSIILMTAVATLIVNLISIQDENIDKKIKNFHPKGKVGIHSQLVKDIMRTKEYIPFVRENDTIMNTIHIMTETVGKPGCAIVIDKNKKLLGVFTDGDLRRILEQTVFNPKEKIKNLMSLNPQSVQENETAFQAETIMKQFHIDNLPVVNSFQKVVGFLDIQDLILS